MYSRQRCRQYADHVGPNFVCRSLNHFLMESRRATPMSIDTLLLYVMRISFSHDRCCTHQSVGFGNSSSSIDSGSSVCGHPQGTRAIKRPPSMYCVTYPLLLHSSQNVGSCVSLSSPICVICCLFSLLLFLALYSAAGVSCASITSLIHALRDFSPRKESSFCQCVGRKAMLAVLTRSGRGLRPAPSRLPPLFVGACCPSVCSFVLI
jgi:hypothetical protein